MTRIKVKKNFNVGKYGYLFCTPYLLVFLMFGLFPIIFTFALSFIDWNGYGPMKFVGFQNYIDMYKSNYFYFLSMKNTVIIMLFYIPLDMIFGLLLAYAMYSTRLKFKGFFRVANLLPYITSSVALGMMFMILFDYKMGGINNILKATGIIGENIYWLGYKKTALLVVILAVFWRWLGYYMVMYLAGLSNVPNDIIEAARIDGASGRQMFFHIHIPIIKPIIVFLLITSIVGGFQLMEEPLVIFKSISAGSASIVGGPNRGVLTIVWNIYDIAFQTKTKYGIASAMSNVLFLVIAVIGFTGFKLMTRKEEEL